MKRDANASPIPCARTWNALLQSDEIGFEARWRDAIVTLAAEQAGEALDVLRARAEIAGPDEREAAVSAVDVHGTPDPSDPEGLWPELLRRVRPSWWPGTLDRVAVRVRVHPDADAPDTFGPQAIDPNVPDIGMKAFLGILRMLVENAGTPFSGMLHVELLRHPSRRALTGWKGIVQIGSPPKTKATEDEDEPWVSRETAYLRKQNDKLSAANLKMFQDASSVIHASAAAINATRGVNLAPPWMKDGEGEDMPLWMKGLFEAGRIAMEAFTGQEVNPRQVASGARRVLESPAGGPRRLPPPGWNHAMDPAGPPPVRDPLGYDQYDAQKEWGETDEDDPGGWPVSSDSIVQEDEPATSTRSEAPYRTRHGDGDEPDGEPYDESDDGTEHEEESENEDGSSPLSFDGRSEAEVFAALEAWIDRHPNPSSLRRPGMNLAKKIL